VIHTYLLFVGLIFAINVLPVFSPPTWVLLVFYTLNSHLHTAAIIILGVIGASSGRYLLARLTGLARNKLSVKTLSNLEGARKYLARGSMGKYLYFLFFIVSPLPSAQIFEAAALVQAPLVPLTIAFIFGRTISY
jgi:hypothetical protein